MLYNRLDDDELERAVYIDPTNTAARDEMLTRLPALVERARFGDELEEAKMELADANSAAVALRDEVEALENDVAAGDTVIEKQQAELDAANARIAQLTRAKDLV